MPDQHQAYASAPNLPPWLSPEATLHAVFAQALAGRPVALPPGATAARLRAALALDGQRMEAIFAAAREQVLRAARADQPLPERQARAPTRRGVRGRLITLGAGALLITLAIGYDLHGRPAVAIIPPPPPPISTAILYRQSPASETAFAALQTRAVAGDEAARFDLGTLLDSNLLPGETVIGKDDAASFGDYLQAANAGFAAAENNLAFDYETGHGVAHDNTLAAHWYLAAAAQNLRNAQNSLGFMYQSGRGVAQNPASAAAWYQKAAAQGLAIAQNNLASAYESGTGVAQNFALAAAWFQRAAAQGEANAQNSLGYLYFKGLGVAADPAKSFQLFSQSAAQGNPAAELNLGYAYATGTGTGKDQILATRWFLRAQADGDPSATTVLSAMSPPLAPTQLTAAKSIADSSGHQE